MELSEYEENYNTVDYQVYIIIGFGRKNNIIYFKVIYSKINAFAEFNNIFNIEEYDFFSCDSRGFYIDNGKCLLNGFDNNIGLINLIGFNTIFDILYIKWDVDVIEIYCDKPKNKGIKLEKNSEINKLKYYIESVLW